MTVHVRRWTVVPWRSRRSRVPLVIVHVLTRILIVARVGLPHHRVGSARSSGREVLFLSSIVTIVRSISLYYCWKIAVFSPESLLMTWRTAGPQTVAPDDTARPGVVDVLVGDRGLSPAPHHRLHLLDVHGRDGAGVHHGLRPVRRGRARLVTNEARPLLGQTNKFIVRGIESGVHSVLEV